MKTSTVLLLLCASLTNFGTINTAKILGLVPFPCKSHAILGSALLKELAKRGHEVTMISSFPLENRPANYRDIYIDIEKSKRVHEETIARASQFPFFKVVASLQCCTRVSEALLEDERVKAFLASGESFDLVISLGKEALLGFGYALNASVIRFNMLGMHSIYAAVTMNPLPSAYVPNFLLPYADEMHFGQRVINTLMNLFFDIYIRHVWLDIENAVVQKHFPGAPHLRELQRDVDVTFVNTHMAIENARPHMPNVIPIGGFHLHEPEVLDPELQRFLDGAEEGAILFSMGSSIRADILRDKLNETLRCFGGLRYRVLWKHDVEVRHQPANVKALKWLPQKAVLAHPNLKLFITHGGLGSVLESVYYAVPMIVLPIYLDQHKNAAQAVRDGYALRLDVATLSEGQLGAAIREVTANPAYAAEIAVRSRAFRHQDVAPMERAVYWVERVIEHKRRANYLKCAAKDMPLYQYYLLDVAAFIFVCVAACVYLLYATIRKLARNLLKIIFRSKKTKIS